MQLVINDDEPLFIHFHAGLAQSQVIRIGTASHGDQQMGALYLRRPTLDCQMDYHPVSLFFNALDLCVQADIDPLLLQDFFDR